MSSSPRVTVYIPCHHYGRFLKQAIESVLNQSFTDWELIVVDDGSEDETAEVAARFQKEQPERIRVLRHAPVRGLQYCANVALTAARGEYLMRLDADDFLDENALLVLATTLSQHPEVALVYPNFIYVDEQGNYLGVEHRKRIGDEAKLLDLPAHGAGTLARRCVLQELGGYDQRYRSQDGYELWLKVIQRYPVANVRTPLFFYRQHPASQSRNEERLLETRRRIKRDVVNQRHAASGLRSVAIVSAKNTYESFLNVALTELAGVPLIDYTLQAAKAVGSFESILVTTDDPKVIEHCRRCPGIEARLRPRELSRDRVLESEVAEDAVRWLEEGQKIRPDIVVLLSIHSPLRGAEHIREAIDTLILYETDSIVSVYEDYELHYLHGADGLIPLNPAMHRQIRLEREALYVNNGAIRACWRDRLTAEEILGDKVGHIVMPRHLSHQIKTPQDLRMIEQLLPAVQGLAQR